MLTALSTPSEASRVTPTQTAWRYEAWLHAYPLKRETVLDYFKHSDFYDRTCNNEVAIMQTNNTDAMRLMEGIEYSVDPSSTNDFFLIRKSWRLDPQTTHLLALYYVVGMDAPTAGMPPRGTVFPMPDLHAVLKTNLASSLIYLQSAFDELSQHSHFHPAIHGYQWSGGATDKEDEKKDGTETTPSEQSKGIKNETDGTKSSPSSSPSSAAAASTGSSVSVVSTSIQPSRHAFSNLIDSAITKLATPYIGKMPPQSSSASASTPGPASSPGSTAHGQPGTRR